MQIQIPNKDLIDPTTIKKIEVTGFAIKPSGPAEVLFSVSPAVTTILDSEFFEFDDSFSKTVDYVQFKYSHSNAIKSATWHNKKTTSEFKRVSYIKIGIPESIKNSLNNIESVTLETIIFKDNVALGGVALDVSLSRVAAVDFVELPIEDYDKCAKIQFRVLYKTSIQDVIKFNDKTQSIYRSKILAAAQMCVRHKTSALFEDSVDGRFECLVTIDEKIREACSFSKEAKGTKNLVYYTIFFNKGYIELLDKSVCSILDKGEPNFDLLLITDEDTKRVIELMPFRKRISPKYLILDTPVDGVEASQNKVKVFEYESMDEYDKVLFLDCDIVCLQDINTIFDCDLEYDTLYTARNNNLGVGHLKNFHHGFEFLDNSYIREMTLAKQMPFNAGQFLFRNSDRMRAHFNNVCWFMLNWAGEYFFEQSFMCYYFCKAYITDDALLQKYMSIVSTTTTTEYNITEDTCLVHFIAPPLDAKTKLKFIDFFLKEYEDNDKHVTI